MNPDGKNPDWKKRLGAFRSSITNLDGILKGEILSRLAGTVETEDVERMTKDARRRFGPNGLWTIGALDVTGVTSEACELLRDIFEEFRQAGGVLLIVMAKDLRVRLPFQRAARQANNVQIVFVEASKEATEAAKKHRDASKKLIPS